MAKLNDGKTIYVESVEPIFGLHWFVGVEDGLFAEEGLDVEMVAPKTPPKFADNDPARHDHRHVNSFNYQNMYEGQQCDAYRSCEWGQIRRTYDGKRAGQIAFKRPSIVCQGLYARPDSPINTPMDLANKPIGVQFHQGSHYTTLATLESFMDRDEIKCVHAGIGWQRYEELESGKVEASSLVAPYNTLAEKNGFKRLSETHYHGLENFTPDLDEETREALTRGFKKAVVNFNADKKRYIHIMLKEMPEHYRKQISEDDFYLPRIRLVDPQPYLREEFEYAAGWMNKWDLVPDDAAYEQLVAG